MKYHFTYIKMICQKDRKLQILWGCGKLESHSLLVGIQNDAVTVENILNDSSLKS